MRVFIGLMLTVIFLLPSIIQLSHLSENHEHAVCFDHSEHVHKVKPICQINDFQYTSFQFVTPTPFKTDIIITFGENPSFYTPLDYHSNKSNHYHLRAPPSIS